MSAGHGHVDPANKKVALLIAVLALVLAITETLGKGSQTSAISLNIEASNIWALFQAKTIRGTVLKTAAEFVETELPSVTHPGTREAHLKRIEEWRKNVARYDSEPETREGRKELAVRAKEAEAKRDRALAAYHHFEVGSAAVQIAIVLASASVITAAVWLVWVAGGLGLLGIFFCAVGIFVPQSFHLL